MQNFSAIGPAVTEKQKAENFGHPTGRTSHVPQWVLDDTVEGIGVPIKEDRLSIGLSVPEV